MKNILNKELVERYSRQIVLKDVGPTGQKKIMNSKVLVVGAGGLGTEVLRAMGQLREGEAVVAGFAIVILAIMIDRISQGYIDKKTL